MRSWELKLKEALAQDLPGWAAQQRMMNYARPRVEDVSRIDPEARQGAVLALIYPRAEILHMVLTLRHSYHGVHSDQVSFPGGKAEPFDVDRWHTALRETQEEIGVDPEQVHRLGALTQVYIPPSRFLVSPFVGYLDTAPQLAADPFEVKSIIEVPVSHFLDSSNIGEKPIYIAPAGRELPVKYYDVQGHTVWGATAMIISELCEVITRSDLF